MALARLQLTKRQSTNKSYQLQLLIIFCL